MFKNLLEKFRSKSKQEFCVESKAIDKQPIVEKHIQEYSKEPYNFQTITVADLVEKKEAMFDLYTNKSDGFLIKNFLSESEVDTILANLDKALNDNPANTSVGFTYPPIFAEFSNRMKDIEAAEKQNAIQSYFEKTTVFNENFAQNFGIDIKERVEGLYKAISGGRDIAVAEGSNQSGNYPFATFRYLVPDKGLMAVHCGNYFGKTFEEFYKDLTKKVAVENQMSYFIMLQEPETGGELTLFNFRWKAGQSKIDNMEDNEIIQPDGSKMYVENNTNIIKDKIKPKKGDMILFQGGNIWHRVETVRGNTPRITFGGFIGISIDKTKFYYWS
jgi:hapalindole-type alkaloid chlorinase